MAYSRPNGTDRFQILSGNKQGLPSAEVDEEYNGLTDFVNGLSTITQPLDEWTTDGGSPVYTSPTTFTLANDQTAIYMTARKVRFSLTGPLVYSTVVGSSYAAGPMLTTITIEDSVLTANLDIAYYGTISAGANSSLPTDHIPDDAVNYIHKDGSVALENAQVLPGELTTLAEVNVAQVNASDEVEIGDETVPLVLKGNALTFDSGTGGSALIIVGEIRMWSTDAFVPSGWLLCNGQEIDRTTYAGLFAVIASLFGDGNGVTTFNIPDFQGRSPLGVGTGDAPDATAHAVADKDGTEGHTLTVDELGAHTHTTDSEGDHFHTLSSGSSPDPQANSAQTSTGKYITVNTTNTSSAGAHTHTAEAAGADDPHNNLHPFLGVYFIIKS